MSAIAGPNVPTSGLALSLDPANLKSNRGRRSLINWDNWVSGGTGSVTGYNQNGDGNSRLIDTDPFGNQNVVWQSLGNDVTSDADGGWNTTSYAIDCTKRYRYSTWIKRKVLGNGSYYLGCAGSLVNTRSNDVLNTNPYFIAAGWSLSVDVWYLVVGHIWPSGSGAGANHTESGIYTVASGKVASIANDFIWIPTATTSYHRSYLYYSTDPLTNQQWYQPRVDVCDGSEPTIAKLLGNAGDLLYDISGNSNNGLLTNGLVYDNGSIVFNGVDDYIDTGSDILVSPTNQGWTAEYWFNTTSAATLQHFNGAEADDFNANWLAINTSKLSVWNVSPGYWKYGSTVIQNNTWYQGVFICDAGGTNMRFYINGIQEGGDHVGNSWTSTYSALKTRYIGRYEYAGAYSRYFIGKIPTIKFYNRALTEEEVNQNFNALRGRYGI